jgi:hypothetical protein
MVMKTILLVTSILVLFQVASYPLELSRLVLTRDIKDNEPADSDTVFFLIEGGIYCFTEFQDVQKATKIFHKWFCCSKLVGRIELKINNARRWRTWSKKRFKNCAGQWMVQVCDQNGKVLAEKKFLVREL